MSHAFRCPNGHSWPAPVTLRTASSDAPQETCPHCGESGHSDADFDTPPPPRGVPPSISVSEDALTIVQPGAPTFSHSATIPGFEIIRELGRGGMGIVYQAWQPHLKRTVALKVIRLGRFASTMERARFLNEAGAIARLNHPNIVQLYEAGDSDDGPYFTLEFISGGSLDRQLRKATLAPVDAAHLVAQLSHGMHHAHEQGILHRDLKPANVLLSKSEIRNPKSERKNDESVSDFEFRISDFEPKVTDFGLARATDTDTRLTHTGDVLGTPSYMAPEQVGGSKGVDRTADVYALGAILYECLTGRPPFLGATPSETIRCVQFEEPLPLSRIQRFIPRDLETIALKCLQKEPERRYPTAQALAEDLERFLAGKPIQARPVSLLERGWRWCRRNRLVAGLLAALVVALVGGVAGITWKWLDAEKQRVRAVDAEQKERARADDLAVALVSVTESGMEVGRLQLRSGELAQAIRNFETACTLLESRPANERTSAQQIALVKSHTYLGVLKEKDKQESAALREYQQACDELSRLPATAAAVQDRSKLATACFVLGAALLRLKDAQKALEPMRQAVYHLGELHKESKGRLAERKALSKAMYHLGEIQRQIGKPEDAAKTALEREKLWPAEPNEVYDVACELARCMKTVGVGQSTLTPEQQAERKRYGDEAMAVLKRAVAIGLRDVASAAKDEDLYLLKDRADFQALIKGSR